MKQRIGAILVLGLWLWSCAPQSSNPDIDQYAAQCNAGYAASCIAMQEIYNQANVNAQIGAEQDIAAHAQWQNYWLAQQQSWDSFNATNNANIRATMGRLAQ
jgi:hypothetical protein